MLLLNFWILIFSVRNSLISLNFDILSRSWRLLLRLLQLYINLLFLIIFIILWLHPISPGDWLLFLVTLSCFYIFVQNCFLMFLLFQQLSLHVFPSNFFRIEDLFIRTIDFLLQLVYQRFTLILCVLFQLK